MAAAAEGEGEVLLLVVVVVATAVSVRDLTVLAAPQGLTRITETLNIISGAMSVFASHDVGF